MLIKEMNHPPISNPLIPIAPILEAEPFMLEHALPIFDPNIDQGVSIKKRRSTRYSRAFLGTPTRKFSLDERTYNLILHQRVFTEELVQFESINCHILQKWLSFNGLTSYLEDIQKEKIYKSKLTQFFVNIKYEREGTPIITSLVNKKFIAFTPNQLAHWSELPNIGIYLSL